MNTKKIIIDGENFNVPNYLVNKIKNEIVNNESIKEQIYTILNKNIDACIINLGHENINTFEKGGYNLFVQDIDNQKVFIHYDKIWSIFQTELDINYSHIKAITSEWVKDVLDLKGYSTTFLID